MKTLRGLDQTILTLDGKEYSDHATVKTILMKLLFNGKADPATAIRISNKILPMIIAAKNAVEFEDSDFNIVKTIATTNTPEYNIGIFAQVMKTFEDNNDDQPKATD